MEDTEEAHLAGLFDGAGLVTVHIGKDDAYSIGYRFTPAVRLSRPRDDEATLGKLDAYAEEYGVGYGLSEEDTSNAIFKVTRNESIVRFLEPLLPWLITTYEDAVIMIEEIIPRLEDGDFRTEEGFYELVGYADAIRNDNRRGHSSKYTQEYFGRLWGL